MKNAIFPEYATLKALHNTHFAFQLLYNSCIALVLGILFTYLYAPPKFGD